jgi:hypothetical protein
MLHERRISSFLVTNAQFPEAMRSLRPVCQLYVSVDAANKVHYPTTSNHWTAPHRLSTTYFLSRERFHLRFPTLLLVRIR